MMLILDNATEEPTETLLIEEADPDRERWMGKKRYTCRGMLSSR